jgi:hypothetical protein
MLYEKEELFIISDAVVDDSMAECDGPTAPSH